MSKKLCVRCKKMKPLEDYGTFKNGECKLTCKPCAVINNSNHKSKSQPVNYAGKPTGRLCHYCGERKHHSLFPMHKDGGSRDVICLDCLPRIEKAGIEWGQIALQPINGDRYHRSVGVSYGRLEKPRKRATRRVDCDYGSGIGMRGAA